MPISVSTSLPDCVLNALKQFADVIVRDGEIPVIELVESREGKSVFIKFLHDNSEVDPLLSPAFGNPLNPYVSPIAQVEVFNLLATYQPLLLPDLAANVFPFIPAQLPVMAGFQYHHSKRAILAVQEDTICKHVSWSLRDSQWKRHLRFKHHFRKCGHCYSNPQSILAIRVRVRICRSTSKR